MGAGRSVGQTDFDYAHIRRLFSSGVPPYTIASRLGCSKRTVSRALSATADEVAASAKTARQTGSLRGGEGRGADVTYKCGRRLGDLNDEGDIDARYRDLAAAIVNGAVVQLREDYRSCLRRGGRPTSRETSWFFGEWCAMLCAPFQVEPRNIPGIVLRQETERARREMGDR